MKNSILKTALLAAITISSTSTFAAISDQEFAKCAALEGDLSRLECFDNLAKDKNLDGQQVQTTSIEGTGDWDVNVKINPIDDSKTVTLILKAETGESKWNRPYALLVRCKSNETNVFIGWSEYLGREANVLTRIGSNKAVTQPWDMSTDSKATFHPNPITFLKEVLSSDKLVAQVTPYNENPATAIFNTAGLENAIKPLRETCNW
ncbi:type VI secretion system-associated protein TagO [Pseudoalteromonas sp. PAMC 22718]|jgi:type VI secretion system protein VasI|uniref:type VI secretion system-associated protein TagO n=1 Tax=Pseudoalteromonas sp. PAMC 22718 TaxID=1175295 RepID=UPI0002D6228C|nr:type VI secretion system-associated protein TagO [Pseudoalteromonas sp. PAMC 22718]